MPAPSSIFTPSRRGAERSLMRPPAVARETHAAPDPRDGLTRYLSALIERRAEPPAATWSVACRART